MQKFSQPSQSSIRTMKRPLSTDITEANNEGSGPVPHFSPASHEQAQADADSVDNEGYNEEEEGCELGDYDFGEDYTSRLRHPMPQWYYDKYYGSILHHTTEELLLDTDYAGPAENVHGRNAHLSLEKVMSWADVDTKEPLPIQSDCSISPGPTNDVFADLEAKNFSEYGDVCSEMVAIASDPDTIQALMEMGPPEYKTDDWSVGASNDSERPPELLPGYKEQRPKRITRRNIVILHHNQVVVEMRRRAATKAEFEHQEERERNLSQVTEIDPDERDGERLVSNKSPEIPDKPYLHEDRPEWEEMEKTRAWVLAAAKNKRLGLPEPPNKPVPIFPQASLDDIDTDYVPHDIRRYIQKEFETPKEFGSTDSGESELEADSGSQGMSSDSTHNSDDDEPVIDTEAAPPVPQLKNIKSFSTLGKKELSGESSKKRKSTQGSFGRLPRNGSFGNILRGVIPKKSAPSLSRAWTMSTLLASDEASVATAGSTGTRSSIGAGSTMTGARSSLDAGLTLIGTDRAKTPDIAAVGEDIFGVSPSSPERFGTRSRTGQKVGSTDQISRTFDVDHPIVIAEPAPPVPQIKYNKSFHTLGKELGGDEAMKGQSTKENFSRLRRDGLPVDMLGDTLSKKSPSLSQFPTPPGNFAAKEKSVETLTDEKKAARPPFSARPHVIGADKPKTPGNTVIQERPYGTTPPVREAARNRTRPEFRNEGQCPRKSSDGRPFGDPPDDCKARHIFSAGRNPGVSDSAETHTSQAPARNVIRGRQPNDGKPRSRSYNVDRCRPGGRPFHSPNTHSMQYGPVSTSLGNTSSMGHPSHVIEAGRSDERSYRDSPSVSPSHGRPRAAVSDYTRSNPSRIPRNIGRSTHGDSTSSTRGHPGAFNLEPPISNDGPSRSDVRRFREPCPTKFRTMSHSRAEKFSRGPHHSGRSTPGAFTSTRCHPGSSNVERPANGRSNYGASNHSTQGLVGNPSVGTSTVGSSRSGEEGTG